MFHIDDVHDESDEIMNIGRDSRQASKRCRSTYIITNPPL